MCVGPDVARYLRRDRIPYRIGRGGRPCTTIACINRALLGQDVEAEEFDFRATA